MAKQTLKISTPCGEFTRTTNTAYTHVVVSFATSRCGETFDTPDAVAAYCAKYGKSGVHGRVAKDRGYIVSWHKSFAAALYAAEKGNNAYFNTRDGRVFTVEPDQPKKAGK